MQQTQERPEGRRATFYPLVMTAAVAAVLCVVSPFALSIGPIPITLCTLVIYLSLYALNWKRGAAAVLVYVLLGAAGMPVFSGFAGGLGKVAGPTGGYIVGFVLLALVSGWLMKVLPQNWLGQLAAMLVGTALLYTVGTIWYCIQAGSTWQAALGLCVIPFLPGDGLKILAALKAGPAVRKALRHEGLYLE